LNEKKTSRKKRADNREWERQFVRGGARGARRGKATKPRSGKGKGSEGH